MKFEPFSVLHAATLAAIALAIYLTVRAARHAPPSVEPTRVERAIGIGFVGVWLAMHGWWLLPPRLDPLTTLPLQLCHWTALASGWYLATRWRWLAALLYFWGYGLSTQALVTPTLREGPALVQFWYFWLSHAMIVGVPTYTLLVHGYRPTWADWRFACVAAALYAALIIIIDLALGANYGFLGPSAPEQPTLVDLLGPWPERLPIIFALVAGVMAALMIPWMVVQRRAARNAR